MTKNLSKKDHRQASLNSKSVLDFQYRSSVKHGFHLDILCLLFLVLVYRTKTKSRKKQCAPNGNTPQNPKRATMSILHSQFHSFAPILNHKQVAVIKSHERPERARKSNEKQKEQQRATKSKKSSKEQQKTKTNIIVEKPNQAIKRQNEQQSARKLKMETRL